MCLDSFVWTEVKSWMNGWTDDGRIDGGMEDMYPCFPPRLVISPLPVNYLLDSQ